MNLDDYPLALISSADSSVRPILMNRGLPSVIVARRSHGDHGWAGVGRRTGLRRRASAMWAGMNRGSRWVLRIVALGFLLAGSAACECDYQRYVIRLNVAEPGDDYIVISLHDDLSYDDDDSPGASFGAGEGDVLFAGPAEQHMVLYSSDGFCSGVFRCARYARISAYVDRDNSDNLRSVVGPAGLVYTATASDDVKRTLNGLRSLSVPTSSDSLVVSDLLDCDEPRLSVGLSL